MEATRTLTLVFADAAEEQVKITISKPDGLKTGSEIDAVGKAIVTAQAVAVDGNPIRVCTQFIKAYYTMQIKQTIDFDL